RNSRLGDVNSLTGQVQTAEEVARQFDKVARTTPKEAARIILEGVRKNRARVLVGFDAHLIDSMQRLLPTTYQKLLVFGAKHVG
ncbi:MAG: short-chain dehydrogenase, partial [Ketobacteraceae bacterium]|nr:short-chain dehydrogenase [Ketobacteraceae bacterium]